MFNLTHILFMVFTVIGLTITFILCRLFIKHENKKDVVLKIAAILTLIFHYSPLYVDYFTTGTAEISDTMILPVYPCNVAMWLLVIVAFVKNKKSKFFRILATSTFYLGMLGGIIGIAFNEIYNNNPTLADWDVLNGLLSHVTLMLGCGYVLVGKYIQIRVANVFALFCGGVFLLADGFVVIGLHKLFGIECVNCMYLLGPPFEDLPWLNVYVIGASVLVLSFVVTAIIEQIVLSSEERWYNKFKRRTKE